VGLIQVNVGDLHDGLLFGAHGRGKYIDGFGRAIALAAKIPYIAIVRCHLISIIVIDVGPFQLMRYSKLMDCIFEAISIGGDNLYSTQSAHQFEDSSINYLGISLVLVKRMQLQ
jgi:hypothetical protein